MLILVTTKKYRKPLQRVRKRGKNLTKLEDVVRLLRLEQPLPIKHKDHALIGNLAAFRECHLEGDWILLYRVVDGHLYLEATGSHSDLLES